MYIVGKKPSTAPDADAGDVKEISGIACMVGKMGGNYQQIKRNGG